MLNNDEKYKDQYLYEYYAHAFSTYFTCRYLGIKIDAFDERHKKAKFDIEKIYEIINKSRKKWEKLFLSQFDQGKLKSFTKNSIFYDMGNLIQEEWTKKVQGQIEPHTPIIK